MLVCLSLRPAPGHYTGICTHSPHNIVVHLCSPPNTTKSNLSPSFHSTVSLFESTTLSTNSTCSELDRKKIKSTPFIGKDLV